MYGNSNISISQGGSNCISNKKLCEPWIFVQFLPLAKVDRGRRL